ncbi:molecular chaperone HtpG, partial [Helicobacter pylori]
LLEKYAQKGYDVLLLSDEIDAFVMPGVNEYDKTPFRDASHSESLKELGLEEINDEVKDQFKDLMKAFEENLKDEIKGVELSSHLTSAVALIGDEQNAMMANFMRQMGQSVPESKKTLELNPNHAILQKLLKCEDKEQLSAFIWLLYDGAKLLEKGALKDAKSFNERLNSVLLKAL